MSLRVASSSGPFNVVGVLARESDDGLDAGGDDIVELEPPVCISCEGALVAMTMWMRRRLAAFSASAARSTSIRPGACQAGDDRRVVALADAFPAIALTLSKSPGEAMAKPASRTSTPRLGQGFGHADLFVEVHREAG